MLKALATFCIIVENFEAFFLTLILAPIQTLPLLKIILLTLKSTFINILIEIQPVIGYLKMKKNESDRQMTDKRFSLDYSARLAFYQNDSNDAKPDLPNLASYRTVSTYTSRTNLS